MFGKLQAAVLSTLTASILTKTTPEFILFADIDDNYKYDGGSDCAESSECVNKYNIKRGNKISKICVTFGGADYCSDLSALEQS